MIETKDAGNLHPIETTQRIVLRLVTSEQKSTLHHPIRSRILEVLGAGILDFQVTTDTKEEILEDGTGITHLVSTKTPFQRHWMTVAEIQDEVEVKYPNATITNHRCYYHLQILVDLGMVEQFPPVSLDEAGNKQRSRGKRFRTTARFFVSCLRDISPEISDQIIDTLKNCWGVQPSVDEINRLNEILLTQDNAIVTTMEYLATNLRAPPKELLKMPLVLEQLAWILLSDDEEFINLHREAKRILITSGSDLLCPSTIDSVRRQNNN